MRSPFAKEIGVEDKGLVLRTKEKPFPFLLPQEQSHQFETEFLVINNLLRKTQYVV